jgi:hypothetical protein
VKHKRDSLRNPFPGTIIFKIYIITIKIPRITIIGSMLRTLEHEIREKTPCNKVMGEFAHLKLKNPFSKKAAPHFDEG